MRIALELRSADVRRGGIGRYTQGMVRSLLNEASVQDRTLSFILMTARHAETFPEFTSPIVRRHQLWRWSRNGILRNGLLLPLSSCGGAFDLLHSCDYLGPYSFFRKKLIVTIHDLIPHHYPELATPRHRWVTERLLPRAVRLADAILVQSHYVAEDLIASFKLDRSRLRVIPPGVDSNFHVPDEAVKETVRKRCQLPQRFVFFIKGEDPKKNLPTAVKALQQLWEQSEFSDLSLVVSGRLTDEQHRAMSALAKPFQNRIRWMDFVPEDALPAIYSAAQALLFPSLCEGYGMPVLEAMACGCPVVTSNLTSLPEVAGEAAICLPPHDHLAIAAALREILVGDELRSKFCRAGLQRAAEFTWQRSAREVLRVYEDLLS